MRSEHTVSFKEAMVQKISGPDGVCAESEEDADPSRIDGGVFRVLRLCSAYVHAEIIHLTTGGGLMSTTRINWYHTPIDKDRLKSLTRKSNIRPLLHIVAQFALTAATGVGAYLFYLHLPWPFLIPAIWIHGTVYTFLGASGAGHELSHRTVFRSRGLNEFFMAVTSFLSFFPYVHFRKSHAKHHQLTVHEGEDLEVILPLTIKRFTWFWLFTINIPGMIHILGLIGRHALGIYKSEWEQRILPPSDTKGRSRASWWARITLLGQSALAMWFVASGNWIFLLLVTFAPFSGNWLNFLCGFTQHAGLTPSVPDFRICCRTVLLGPLPRFLYWSMNYHVEHHMFAGVPFYNLGRLRREIEWDVPVAHKGLRRAWGEILPVMRRQRSDPDFCVVPSLPETANPARMGKE
jgi:fatty acid desaturase